MVDNKAYDVLQGGQGLSVPPDEDAQVIPLHTESYRRRDLLLAVDHRLGLRYDYCIHIQKLNQSLQYLAGYLGRVLLRPRFRSEQMHAYPGLFGAEAQNAGLTLAYYVYSYVVATDV